MKRYSAYFWMMQACAVLALIIAIMCLFAFTAPGACAIFCTISFLLCYSGVMAPDEEKYVEPRKSRRL